MSYDIVVECKRCHKNERVSSSVPRKKFLQGYVDRGSAYLCAPCWSFCYHKGIKFPFDIPELEPIYTRFEILDL